MMKRFLPHVLVVVLMMAVSAFFFAPSVFHGKILIQGDIEKYEGMAQEVSEYAVKEGKGTAWTGSMFSGMPVYTITTPYGPRNVLEVIYKTGAFMGTRDAGVIFMAMLSMYLLLCFYGMDKVVSFMGAFAYSFSSYFIIIIAAGHVTKAWAMSLMPLVLLGLLLMMRGKRLVGGLTFAIALATEVWANHLQITYYLAIFCVFIVLAYVVWAVENKKVKTMGIIAGVSLLGVCLAVLVNSATLSANMEMSKTSIRGESRLTSKVDNKQDKSSGLDRDYAFAWSYGIGESLTVLIPNIYGGESGGELDRKDSNLAQAYRDHGAQVPDQLRTYTYWGEQPFTSGPVYFGAIICFLFLLSLFVVKSNYVRAAAFFSTLFFFMLSWGKNFDFNDTLFHNLPLYNKFRTPSMALVIPQLVFVLMACLALKKLVAGEFDKRIKNYIYISAGITGGICLILWLVPGIFLDFSCSSDETAGMPGWYLDALMEDRKDLLTSDAFRSLVLIALSAGAVYLMSVVKEKKYVQYLAVFIAALTLFDLWNVDRRYLDDSNFAGKSSHKPFQQTVADQAILADSDPSYRVLTLSNPFNDTHVSYFHKSIGGYNAAKLRDYQDLIDMRIEPEMKALVAAFPSFRTQQAVDSAFAQAKVLNMLNMRYLIYNDNAAPLRNPHALGNAWFVDELKVVETDDDEMTALNTIDVAKQAVVHKSFAKNGLSASSGNTGSVKLTSYKPDSLKYESNSDKDGVVVFSEVYYPHGWQAFIDGKPVEHFRANWILRGLQVPAGKHEIVFAFHPQTYWILRSVGSVLSYLLVIALVVVVGYAIYCNANGKKNVLSA